MIAGDDIIKIFDLELTSDSYYSGYNDTVNPSVANAFSTAAYRFGHSLVQSSFVRVDMQHRPIFDSEFQRIDKPSVKLLCTIWYLLINTLFRCFNPQ